MLGRLLCRIGWHDYQFVGQYYFRARHFFQCSRCNQTRTVDINNKNEIKVNESKRVERIAEIRKATKERR